MIEKNKAAQCLAGLVLCLVTWVGSPAAAADDSARDPVRIVVLGDSLAAGYGVERHQAWPALLQSQLEKAGFHTEMRNAGVSGDTSASGLRRIEWILKRPLDILILGLGGNDGLRGIEPATIKENLAGIIQKTRAEYGHAVILLAGMRMPDTMGEEYASAYQAVFASVAEEEEVLFLPFLLEGVGGVPELNQADLIHPNEKGHQLIAANVFEILVPAVEQMRSK